MCRQCVCVAKFKSYSWWIAVILGFKIGGYGIIRAIMISSSDVQFYPKGKLGQGSLGAKQESSDRYSYGGANSHRTCVDQGDRWIIKFRLGLNLFDLIKL